MALYFTLYHRPKLFYWVKFRRVSKKIHTFISSILDILPYVSVHMIGCIVYDYMMTFHIWMFIHFIENHFQETDVVTCCSSWAYISFSISLLDRSWFLCQL